MVNPGTAPPLTVWLGKAMYTFLPGQEVTIGRSGQCDICLDDPAVAGLISRVHAVVESEGAGWTLVDRSRNGIFVDGNRVATVPVRDGQSVTVGSVNGPRLTFRTPVPDPSARRRPPPGPASAAPPRHPGPPRPSAQPQPAQPRPAQDSSAQAPPASSLPGPPPAGDSALFERTIIAQARPGAQPPNPRVTGGVRRAPRVTTPPPGSITVGRLAANTVVVDDPLASRIHAIVTRTDAGPELRDNRSSNGTFVNGRRIERVVLHDGDVVTIGNTDLVATDGTLRRREATAETSGLQVYELNLVIDGRSLITDVSFAARPGTLTAVIGPSGAGKSTLIKMAGGTTSPTSGLVTFDGHDVHAEYTSMRSRIGVVPQDDVVHRHLTVDKALRYAAELRLPADTSRADRDAVLDRVLAELELTEHRDKRIDNLSGGQRKRVSVAMELLTGPSLLILDEPTSGLDPALDRQVMTMLRGLAAAGRVVVVVTHSLTYLNMCDQVLLLGPGGKTAFAGPPAEIGAAMGTEDWADIFARVSTDPDGAHREYLVHHPAPSAPQSTATAAEPAGSAQRTSLARQFSAVARRQVRLIFADRGYFVFLAVLPFVLGLLSLVVPGHHGLSKAAPDAAAEPLQLLVLLNIAAVFLGTALTIRDLIGERAIFQREQAVGLSASAYLGAKIAVYCVAAAVQIAVVTGIVMAGKRPPGYGGAVLGPGVDAAILELYLALAATTIVSALAGLLLSSLARSTEQVLPMLVGLVMVSMVFAGGLVPVTGRAGLDQVSYLLPARWGFAATASTIDLRIAMPQAQEDRLWLHTPAMWLLDVAMLAVLGLVCVLAVRWRLRLAGVAHTRGGGSGRRVTRWTIIGSLATVIAIGAVIAVSARHYPPSSTGGESDRIVAADTLDRNLLDAATIGQIVNAPGLVGTGLLVPVKGQNFVPHDCTGAASPAAGTTYGGTALTGMAALEVHDPDQPWPHYVLESAAAFRNGGKADEFVDTQHKGWTGCAGKTVTSTDADGTPAESVIGTPSFEGGMLTLSYTDANRPDRVCRRAMTTRDNVVVDVLACADGLADGAGADIVRRIADSL